MLAIQPATSAVSASPLRNLSRDSAADALFGMRCSMQGSNAQHHQVDTLRTATVHATESPTSTIRTTRLTNSSGNRRLPPVGSVKGRAAGAHENAPAPRDRDGRGNRAPRSGRTAGGRSNGPPPRQSRPFGGGVPANCQIETQRLQNALERRSRRGRASTADAGPLDVGAV